MRTIFLVSILYGSLFLQLFATSLPPAGITSKGFYLVDKTSRLSIDSVKHIPLTSFSSFYPDQEIKFGFNNSTAVWCFIQINNNSAAQQKLRLFFNNIHLDSVSFFTKNGAVLCGDRASMENAVSIEPSVGVYLNSGESEHIYVRIKKIHSYLDFSYHIQPEEAIIRQTEKGIFIIALALGMVFLFLVFNLILFIVSRERIYFFYSLYVLSMIIYLLVSSGFAQFFLFPGFVYFSEIRIYFSFITATLLNLFIIQYIQLRQLNTLLYKLAMGLIFVNWAILICSAFFYGFNQFYALKAFTLAAYADILLLMITVLISVIKNLRKLKMKAFWALSFYYFIFFWSVLFIFRETTRYIMPVHFDWLAIVNMYEVVVFGSVLAVKYYRTLLHNRELLSAMVEEKKKALDAFARGETRERKRLADILHDNFGSRLSAIKLFLSNHDYKTTTHELDSLSSDIRDLSHQIMPKALQEGALLEAIRKHADIHNSTGSALKVEVLEYDMPSVLKEKWIFDIYLITQELIHNAAKYSGSDSLIIEIYYYETDVVFVFQDQGRGFDMSDVTNGRGLETIPNRLESYGATVAIDTRPGEGVIITIKIPLAANEF